MPKDFNQWHPPVWLKNFSDFEIPIAGGLRLTPFQLGEAGYECHIKQKIAKSRIRVVFHHPKTGSTISFRVKGNAHWLQSHEILNSLRLADDGKITHDELYEAIPPFMRQIFVNSMDDSELLDILNQRTKSRLKPRKPKRKITPSNIIDLAKYLKAKEEPPINIKFPATK